VGVGRVFCAELVNPRRKETEGEVVKMRAFRIDTGKLLWETGGGSALRYSEAHDLIVTSSGIYKASDGALAAALPEPPKTPANASAQNVPGPLSIIDRSILWGTVDRFMLRGCTGLRSSTHLVTTRFRANAAYIDLASRGITSLWNIRPGCYNNLFPANGVLNAPSLTGGCTCNYTPASQAYVPLSVIERPGRDM
jgi:hypothetical protein